MDDAGGSVVREVSEVDSLAQGLTEGELWSFLRDIEQGVVTLQPEGEPQEIYAGNVSYTASNGWRIIIFNDANEWDYIDEIVTNDGRSIDYDELFQTYPALAEYAPNDEVAWSRYRIPGYLKFRCNHCGMKLKKRKEVVGWLCDQCHHKILDNE